MHFVILCSLFLMMHNYQTKLKVSHLLLKRVLVLSVQANVVGIDALAFFNLKKLMHCD
jgi:hypothetical protein